MSGLKRYEPALRFTANFGSTPLGAVTPDEIDRYEVVSIPISTLGAAGTWVGTVVPAGTSTVAAITFNNVTPPWPQNVEFAVAGSAAGMAGTLVLNGFDQFGSALTETVTFTPAANGGTGVGTRVFGQYTSGTITLGTAVGVGTPRIGLGTIGTTTLLGLPFKVGGTSDLKIIQWFTGTGAVSLNGGTIAKYIDVPRSAILSPLTSTGSTTVVAWVRPTFNAENLGLVANLTQRT